MSVHKYIVNKKQGNYTTIPNNVLQNLGNYEALGLYCYLISLPHQWSFHKEQLSEHGKIGRDKINKLLKILEVHCLIKITQTRLENGQFGDFDLEVSDGTDFKIKDLQKPVRPFTEKPLTANQLLVNSSYKRNINKTNKSKKEKEISCSTEVEQLESFNSIWFLYKRKQKKKEALKIYKAKGLHKLHEQISGHIKKRNETEWKYKAIEHIPLLSSFLNGERWNDDILSKSANLKANQQTGTDICVGFYKNNGGLI